MAILGISSLDHDASVALVDGDSILFAGHAERYSRVKNDGMVNEDLINDVYQYGEIESIVWYETPMLRKMRYLKAGQWGGLNKPSVKCHLDELGLEGLPVSFVSHHESHAAGGYYTSGFDRAAVVVCDAIGELDTISVWLAEGKSLRRVWKTSYPHSLGLLYSAFTKRIGYKPNEEEYILMGMAAYGEPKYAREIEQDFLASHDHRFILKENVHRGIQWWRPDITDIADIAASIQKVTEDYLVRLMTWVRETTGETNLVYMGGVALNCVANSKITGLFDRIWIMPNPGDAGSSLGAVAAKTREQISWTSPYLGHNIRDPLNRRGAIELLKRGEVIGVAHGRAEFGPRAFGNRSLLCDPRGPLMKDRVNAIKKRDAFRPFAPIVLDHLADQYFDMPARDNRYMQYVSRVKEPHLFPAITHHDGTARVQTLSRNDNPIFYDLLDHWYHETGCPMLLNTSLNIKGEPLVNTREDANRFSDLYGIRVF